MSHRNNHIADQKITKRNTSGSALTVNVNDQAEQICYFSCAVFSSWQIFLTYKLYGWSLVLVAKGWPEYLGTQRLTPGLDILILTLIPWGPRLLFQTHQLYQRLLIHFQQLLNFCKSSECKTDFNSPRTQTYFSNPPTLSTLSDSSISTASSFHHSPVYKTG